MTFYLTSFFFISSSFHLLQQPKELVHKLHDDLVKEKLATLDSAKAFVKVLRSFRNAGKSTIAEVLTSPDSYYIVWVVEQTVGAIIHNGF